jgi:hypothetical protein
MAVTLELPREVEARIEEDAGKLSQDIPQYLAQLVMNSVGKGPAANGAGKHIRPTSSDTQRALDFYATHLQHVLEPERNGKFVALHADSGDYEVASGYGQALRTLRDRQPEGHIVLRRIGPEDPRMLARIKGVKHV